MEGVISTVNAPAAIGPYSQGRAAGCGLVFVSGQLPIDPATGVFPEGGVEVQTRQSILNGTGKILAAVFLSLTHCRLFRFDIFALKPEIETQQENIDRDRIHICKAHKITGSTAALLVFAFRITF